MLYSCFTIETIINHLDNSKEMKVTDDETCVELLTRFDAKEHPEKKTFIFSRIVFFNVD